MKPASSVLCLCQPEVYMTRCCKSRYNDNYSLAHEVTRDGWSLVYLYRCHGNTLQNPQYIFNSIFIFMLAFMYVCMCMCVAFFLLPSSFFFFLFFFFYLFFFFVFGCIRNHGSWNLKQFQFVTVSFFCCFLLSLVLYLIIQ